MGRGRGGAWARAACGLGALAAAVGGARGLITKDQYLQSEATSFNHETVEVRAAAPPPPPSPLERAPSLGRCSRDAPAGRCSKPSRIPFPGGARRSPAPARPPDPRRPFGPEAPRSSAFRPAFARPPPPYPAPPPRGRPPAAVEGARWPGACNPVTRLRGKGLRPPAYPPFPVLGCTAHLSHFDWAVGGRGKYGGRVGPVSWDQ